MFSYLLYSRDVVVYIRVCFIWMNGVKVVTDIFLHLRCAIPGYANDTFDVQSDSHQGFINQSIPLTAEGEYEKCLIYAEATNGSDHVTTQRCSSWVYDRTLFTSTLGMKVNVTKTLLYRQMQFIYTLMVFVFFCSSIFI